MRKLLVALFALGLVVAFTAPVYAATVDFTGHYRWQGKWQYNDEVRSPNSTNQAWMDQRLQVDFTINVAEGLAVKGRFNAMDRVWNGNTTGAFGADQAENIYFRRTYLSARTEYGLFEVGYRSAGTWGTVFADTEADGRPRVFWTAPFGNLTMLALYEKLAENDVGIQSSEEDMDAVAVAGIYKLPYGQAGLLYYYIRDMRETAVGFVPGGYDHITQLLSPYFKLTFGDLYLEGQYYYKFGGFDFADAAIQDVDYRGHSWYLYAKYAINQWYVGGQYAFVAGNDGSDPGKNKAGQTGSDYNPTLLLWNDDMGFNLGSYGNTTTDAMANAWLIQGFVGGNPMPKLHVKAALTYAKAHKTPVAATLMDKEIGTELDLEASYQIFDNLSWWIGFGYLWTGDWYKANNPANQIDDTWMVMHRLQLDF
ncbi:MAG: hypothetical protein M0Q23_08735 [Syntrophales bacterium]|jgi:hypothetical protein|nr:hypothetical protein [Syntrophales bacterium]MCK9528705.1 hypothetical protein [Syntrophales bacterium]MDX9922658.1 hypothetical protein [Syntrophales bacterium]